MKFEVKRRFESDQGSRLPLIKRDSTVHRFQTLFQISSERRFCRVHLRQT